VKLISQITFTIGENSIVECIHLCYIQTLVPKIGYLMNPAKLYKKKAPKEGREKETMGKYQSPSKQAAQTRWATRRKRNH
jgi:hypothetical protein